VKLKEKLKRYRLDFEATITGSTTVEAFDAEDAREQFDSHPGIDEFDDTQINAELIWVTEEKPKKAKR
jgi:hypothetical protein